VTASVPRQDTHLGVTPGAGAVTVDPMALPGAALMYQAAALLGPQLSSSVISPHSSLARLDSNAPEAPEQLGAQSSEMRPRIVPVNQTEFQQQQQRADNEAVRNANAAWTAATWRLISGQQPQP